MEGVRHLDFIEITIEGVVYRAMEEGSYGYGISKDGIVKILPHAKRDHSRFSNLEKGPAVFMYDAAGQRVWKVRGLLVCKYWGIKGDRGNENDRREFVVLYEDVVKDLEKIEISCR